MPCCARSHKRGGGPTRGDADAKHAPLALMTARISTGGTWLTEVTNQGLPVRNEDAGSLPATHPSADV